MYNHAHVYAYCLSIFYIYIYVTNLSNLNIYNYIYTRNAWALPRRSLEVSHSQTNGNDVETLPAYGKYN